MKTKMHYINLLLCMAIFLSGCAEELVSVNADKAGCLTLRLYSRMLSSRIAVEDGADAYNENKISTVDCFFYPGDAADTDDALFHIRQSVAATATNGATVVEVNVPEEQLNQLFPEGGSTTCKVYVIANLPGTTAIGSDTSISALKGLVVEAPGFATDGVQTGFVMDGTDESVYYNATDKSMGGMVPLLRAAAKVAVFVTVEDRIEVEGEDGVEIWESQPQNIHIFFHEGVKKGCIDGAYKPTGEDYFTTPSSGEGRLFTLVEESTNGNGEEVVSHSHVPFYSYPSDWGKETDPDEEPYLVLIVPWKKQGEQNYRPCYYQIPVSYDAAGTRRLDRNNYYKIRLNVGILGSFIPSEQVKLNGSYSILDWGTNQIMTSVTEYRYLVVDRNHVVLDDLENTEIGFLTSHPVEIVNVTVSKPNYSSENSSTDIITNQVAYELKATDDGLIVFEHQLNNDRSSTTYDYVPYTFTFRVQHKDDSDFYEDVEIVQYPAMYIDAEKNPQSNDRGDVYVNGGTRTNSNYGGVHGLAATNQNPNMYVISTSAFVGVTNYVIGDPRTYTINNTFGGNAWSATAPAMSESANRKLSFYYPTDTVSRTENMISPKFRIASSFGVATTQSFVNMQKRCASYQEYGYPAGRWRMPTKAEIEYIVSLSAEGKIPKLFNDNEDSSVGVYWCAHGTAAPQADGTVILTPHRNITNNATHSVRCVYDEWYWNDKCPVGTFTWGDKARW